MSNKTEETLEKDQLIQSDVRELEQFYTTGQIDNLPSVIDKYKENLTNELIEYQKKHKIPTKFNDEGEPIEYKIQVNPLVINNYFFKSLTALTGQEPEYNAERLGIVFDYYCYLIAEVNDKIGNFPSSLTSFCKLAGITSKTLRLYRNSNDYSMRVVVEKIYDQIGDENVTMSQMGIVRERSTIFKMKSQNEMVEKQQPNININITEKPDMEQIEARINKYKLFANKKEK